jgi:hypothetical protein
MWVMNMVAGVLALSPAVFAREMARNEKMGAELYESGIMMERILSAKQEFWSEQRALGVYESAQYQEVSEKIQCLNGLATVVEGDPKQTFRCINVGVLTQLQEGVETDIITRRSICTASNPTPS